NYDITRQGVRDVIVRAEATLTDLEEKTGLIKRFHTMKQQLQQVRQDAQRLTELSARYDDPEIETLSLRIRDAADALLKE
ncbi:MAG: DNA-binding protein, partial [Lawsonibacter sp.]